MSYFKPSQSRPASNPESGFGVTLIAVTIALIMGISVSVYMRQVSTQSLQFQDMYTGSQAHWAAMSGMEWGYYKSEIGEADFGGPYTFFNAIVSLDTSESSDTGAPLPEYYYRVISSAAFGSSERNMRILTKMSMKTVWGDVSIIEGSGDVQIQNGLTINDTIYIGQNVDVQAGTAIGDPPGAQTLLYVPPGAVVTGGQEDANFGVGEHHLKWLFAPDFDTVPYDSLLAIAAAITTDIDNKFDGRTTFKEDILDLNTYTDSTIYCNNVLSLLGMTITGGSVERPGIIVTTGNLIVGNSRGIETTVSDNVIMISGDVLELEDATVYGSDQSALPPKDRPNLHNEVYSSIDLIVRPDVVLWGQAYATDDINIEGEMHGIAYAPDIFRFTKPTSYLEGAIFAANIIGSSGPNRMDRGQLDMDHFFHEEYFKTFDFGVKDNSLLEF
ncbi:MAG: hypothetical protein K9M55_10560 [Candidatus Marinimicrobia bacterium]|nr:hypothetical protein [Candidatus Neomarinimicrobiota bacterium]MCF7923130.1 hypothetical protein [Candidatus Neomarinimicrobiota bacterium]